MADQTNGPASPSSDTEALIENVLNDLADREHAAMCRCDLYPNRCRMAGNYTRKRLLATPGYVRTREALAAALDTRSGTIADDGQPRLFRLHRDQDVSGVSGTGYVADGVLWPDGSATVHWRGEWRTDASHPDGMPSVRAVHGHGGATRIVWADEPARRPCAEKGVSLEKRTVLDCKFEEGHDGWHRQGDSFWRAGAPAHVLAEIEATRGDR